METLTAQGSSGINNSEEAPFDYLDQDPASSAETRSQQVEDEEVAWEMALAENEKREQVEPQIKAAEALGFSDQEIDDIWKDVEQRAADAAKEVESQYDPIVKEVHKNIFWAIKHGQGYIKREHKDGVDLNQQLYYVKRAIQHQLYESIPADASTEKPSVWKIKVPKGLHVYITKVDKPVGRESSYFAEFRVVFTFDPSSTEKSDIHEEYENRPLSKY